MSRFRFIQAEKATYPVAVLCRALQVSRAGYYPYFVDLGKLAGFATGMEARLPSTGLPKCRGAQQ